MTFYVYKWYNVETGEIFYVGKGCRNRKNVTYKRNILFKEYIKNNKCKNEIIAYFNNESDALNFEHKTILELKRKGMCKCNLDNGGTGGINYVWTQEMKDYKSKYNPMKDEKVKQKMAKSKSKIVIYDNKETTTREIASKMNIHITTAQNWAKRGYDTNGNPCYYKNETMPSIKKNTCSKSVLIDGEYFPSLRAAADFLGVKDTSPLCRALKQNRIYKGHKCEYANQQPSEENSD